MSPTMAREGGRVQLEQCDMGLALNMAKMAEGQFSCATIEETECLIKKPWGEDRKMKKWGVEFLGHIQAKAVIERHLAMLQKDQMDGYLPCQNGTAQDPQIRWRRKGTVAPPPERLRQPTPEPTPHPPKMPVVPPGKNEAGHLSAIGGVPPGYVNIHTPLPHLQFCNLGAYAKDCKYDKDFNPDLLTDEGTSTGQYTIRCVVMQLTSILQTTAANWANLTVKMSIDWMKRDCWVYYYLQLADTSMYISMDIFICIIEEQSIDEGESTWRQYKGCQNTINDISGPSK